METYSSTLSLIKKSLMNIFLMAKTLPLLSNPLWTTPKLPLPITYAILYLLMMSN